MPIYKFLCENAECEHVTEFLHLAKVRDDGSVSSDPCPDPKDVQCEECKGTVTKIFEAPAMVRIKFERNGRKATLTKLDGGGEIIRSATREKYEHDVCNKPAKDFKGSRTETVWSNSVQKVVDQKKREKEKKHAHSRLNKKR